MTPTKKTIPFYFTFGTYCAHFSLFRRLIFSFVHSFVRFIVHCWYKWCMGVLRVCFHLHIDMSAAGYNQNITIQIENKNMLLQNKWQMNTTNSSLKLQVQFHFVFIIIILMFCTDNKKGNQFSDAADFCCCCVLCFKACAQFKSM